jgi:hypothetical protein
MSLHPTAQILVLLFLSGISGFAQTYSIDWFSINSGGGTSSGGTFAVNATVGQPAATSQALTGGNFSVMGGFWSLFAVQTPGARIEHHAQPPISVRHHLVAFVIGWIHSATNGRPHHNELGRRAANVE